MPQGESTGPLSFPSKSHKTVLERVQTEILFQPIRLASNRAYKIFLLGNSKTTLESQIPWSIMEQVQPLS